MKRKTSYIWKRLIRSLFSILAIMIVVFVMVYSLVPRDNIFFNDGTYTKLGGKPDEKRDYVMRTWQKLVYLDYVLSIHIVRNSMVPETTKSLRVSSRNLPNRKILKKNMKIWDIPLKDIRSRRGYMLIRTFLFSRVWSNGSQI